MQLLHAVGLKPMRILLLVQREAIPWQHGQGLQPCNHAHAPCKQHVENVVKCLHQTNQLQGNDVIPADSLGPSP
jgi:hypothetical protein